MEKIKTWFRKLGYKIKHGWINFDNVILLVALIFCLSWTWGSISAMSRNWELAERVESGKRELALLQLEVETLELENEYYKSEEYQEISAREKQNKMLSGETMVYLPKNSDAAKNKYQEIPEPEMVELTERTNFEQWMSFLFGA